MSGAIRVLLALVLAASAHATCSADEPADNEALNHFVAATNGCSLANETSETCVIVVSAGYGGGSLTCQGDGNYSATPAQPCAAGTYAAAGAGVCSACAAGTYAGGTNSSSCATCAAGSITNTGTSTGAVNCSVCAAGTYSVESNVSSCTTCSAGSLTNTGANAGATSCSGEKRL
jgi:hypothetical protein